MTQIATTDIRPVARTSRVRPWIALAAAAVVLALGLLGVLSFMLVLPVIGVVLALGAPPDHVNHARSIARRPRNAVLGVVLAAALAVVILHPDLSLPLVTLFGLDGSGLAVIVLAVVALALPMAMTDAPTDTRPDGFLLTRRNLILSLTVLVVVADWYAGRGLSLLPIGVLVLTLPLIIGFSRLVAARRQRIEYDLLRRPLRAELGPHRLQLANVTLLCALLALTLPTGAYDPIALQLTPGYTAYCSPHSG